MASLLRGSLLFATAIVVGCASGPQSPRAPYAMPEAVVAQAPHAAAPFHVLPDWSWAGTLTAEPPSSSLRAIRPGATLGLHDAARFRVATGACRDCDLPAAVLWHFDSELIAVPDSASARIRFDDPPVSVSPTGRSEAVPAVIWLGAPDRITGARLDAEGAALQWDGGSLALRVPPPLPSNRSYIDASTSEFLSGRPLTVRGAWVASDPVRAEAGPAFVARSLWPEDWRLDTSAMTLAPLRERETLGTLIEAMDSGGGPLSTRLLWERNPGQQRNWAGRPVLAFILSGAQGDDDGSRGGHLGVASGYVGPQGQWDHWLVENFYPVDDPNAKGIIPASVPADKYLTDVNSGQLYYRPSYMLVVVLREPRVAGFVHQALHANLLRLYCRDNIYRRGRNNSTAMTMDPLRDMGWRIPTVGPSSRILGWMLAPIMALAARDISMGRELAGALSTERSRLLPRVAFELAGHDLLALIAADMASQSTPDTDVAQGSSPSARAARSPAVTLTPFEQMLAEDVEALVFIRLPQIPSSRRFGSFPERSMLTFGATVVAKPGPLEAAPETTPRPFPSGLLLSCADH